FWGGQVMHQGWLCKFLSNPSRASDPKGRQTRRPGVRRTFPLELEPLEGRLLLASSATPVGLTPAQILHAYGVDQIRFNNGTVVGNGSGQTIAIVATGDCKDIVTDVHGFDVQFHLPDPVITKVAQDGSTIFPAESTYSRTYILEAVEWAHAIAPGAKFLLVETQSEFPNFLVGVDYARRQAGVSVVMMDAFKPESSNETTYDYHFTTPSGNTGITFVAPSGDLGSPGWYPS